MNKEEIMNVKKEAERACHEYCEKMNIGGYVFDADKMKEALKVPENLAECERELEIKHRLYIESFELSCICEMALLYLKEFNPLTYAVELCKENNCTVGFNVGPDEALTITVYGKRKEFTSISAYWSMETIKNTIKDTIRRANE